MSASNTNTSANAEVYVPKFQSVRGLFLNSSVISWASIVIALSFVAMLSNAVGYPLLLGSFGASAAILFVYPTSPFAKIKNVILGHLLCSLVGVIFSSY